jgi:hypothetical protein
VRGLVAIGHSGLTGYLSDLNAGGDARQNSWATGTNPAVDSIYQRLVAALPGDQGQVANTAVDGSNADALEPEAVNALQTVAHPRLVIIQTIDNDIRCDGSDKANLKPFGAAVKVALAVIVKASPKTQILVLSQIGRPADYAAAVAHNKSALLHNEGTGPCDVYDPNGHLVLPAVAKITGLVEGYEAELKKACATVQQCHFDNGAFARYHDTIGRLVTGNWDHLSVAGHASAAALMWPTVARLLHLG